MERSVPIRPLDVRLRLGGVACIACTDLIERDLKNVDGIKSIQANYTLRRAFLQLDRSKISTDDVIERIEKLGYHAYPEQQFEPSIREKKVERKEFLRWLVALLMLMQSMMFMYPFYVGAETDMTTGELALMKWANAVLCLPVIFFCATPIFKGARAELRLKKLGMDTPVSLAIIIAFAASLYATIYGGHIYYDSVTMFVALLLTARYIQFKALNKVGSYLNEVLTQTQRFAEKVKAYPHDKSIRLLPATELEVGDVIFIGSGETIPADAQLIEGLTSCSQALLTGESQPVNKKVGDTLLAGSINLEQGVYAQVVSERGVSELDAIERLAEQSALHKPRLAQVAETAARYFLYALLVVCCAAAIYWYLHEPKQVVPVVVSILIITCPCALALAIPTVLTAASSALAKRHVITVKPEALENLAKVTCYAFDKTGTLTEDVQTLQQIILTPEAIADEWTQTEALQIAATLENASRHPIALALRKALQDQQMPERMDEVETLELTVGQGVVGRINGHSYRIGKPTFASNDVVHIPETQGSSVALLALADGTPIAWFTLTDRMRSDAHQVVSALQRTTDVVLISGDKTDVVQAFAQELNIINWHAESSPTDKLNYLKALQAQGQIVAMTGDGLNDAPVLQQANVAIAMGHGSSLTQMQADFIVQSGDLNDLYATHVIAKRTRQLMWQNLAWALLYNLVAIPLAVMGKVDPLVASVGMAVSSLLVVGNALRILRPIKGLN